MLSIEKREPRAAHYLDDALYDRLAAMRGEAASFGAAADPTIALEAHAFLFHEARLLDCREFDAWLGLFAEELVYWIPTDDAADPRRTISLWLDDRRRLEDRIVRFHTGYVYNQQPERRLRRLVGNVEAWQTDDGMSRRILSNQVIFEHRNGRPLAQHVAQIDHVLIRASGTWKIAIKRAVLINGLDAFDVPTLL